MAPKESSRPTTRTRQRAGESATRNQHRKKKSATRRPDTGRSDESREAKPSQKLSIGALAQLNQQSTRPKKRPERPKPDRPRAERQEREAQRPNLAERLRPEKTKRVNRDEYREVQDRSPDKPRRHERETKRKKRVVSGAIMEEGRARMGLRGGGASSQESNEKEDYYQRPKKKQPKRKLCRFNVVLTCM